MQFEIYRTKAKEFRWRLRADNGEIIAHGESYKRRADLLRCIELVKDVAANTRIEWITS